MIQSKKSLFRVINANEEEVNRIIENIDKFYISFIKKQKRKNGTIKERKIEPSITRLKEIQKRILRNILEEIPLLPCVQGGIIGKDSISNAAIHLGKKHHFCTDIKKFYPSIDHAMVFQTLIDYGFSPSNSSILTKLTTYKGKLPQGNPTSLYIANLVFSKIDTELLEICSREDIVYTRWVDDLIFSSQKNFKRITQDLIQIIESTGFKRSHRKTFYKIGPVEITGVLVKHNILDVTDEKKLTLLSEKLTGESRKGFENYINRIKNFKNKR